MMDIGTTACDMFVDISGQDCTQPNSKLTEAVASLAAGKVLMVVSQKTAALSDVPIYCQQMKLELIEQGEDDQQYYFLIRK